TNQIKMLKIDNSQLRLELSDLKANYLRTRRQLKASHLKRLDFSASSGSRIEELETTFKKRSECFTTEAYLQEHAALNHLGKKFYQQDPSITPIRSTPVVYGFTIDDIGVALFHSTGIDDLVCIKPEAPHAPKLLSSIYLNPHATTCPPRTRLGEGS
ncbi:fatty acid synthase alpha subunit Lsd1, partial [Massospora cicadina]